MSMTKVNRNTKSMIKSAILSVTVVVAGMSGSHLLAQDKVFLSDLDGDGVISAEEIRQIREDIRNSMLETFDTDGDGQLSREERKAIRKARKAEFVSLHDTDGDGELSKAERKQAKAARMEVILSLIHI